MAVVALSWPTWLLLVAALPLFGGFVGYYQGRQAFCVGYALSGVYNVGGVPGDREPVSEAEAAAVDRRKAGSLLARAAASAAVLTLALYALVPLL